MAISTDLPATGSDATPAQSRSLVAACLAHALHDGYTDGLYAFLPLWRTQFGLSYAALAVVRALYYATMGGLQIPADRALRRVPARVALVLSTVLAACGMLIMALSGTFAGLCVGLVVAGVGSSIQHPRASMLVTDAYGDASRRPLGIYNFSGDLGKAALPAVVAVLLPVVAWRPVIGLMAALGIAVALGLLALIPSSVPARHTRKAVSKTEGRGGFTLLTTIGALDTSTRMAYLLFLPFLVHARGGGSASVGAALALLFIGGALGKATCTWLGERFGVVASIMATEAATAALIVATLFAPLNLTLVLLPLLGIVLNGTSSLLYGAVPKLSSGDTGQAFAVFYTAVIGAGGVAPVLFGIVADHASRQVAVLAAAGTAAAIVPLVVSLRPHLTGIAVRHA